MTVYLAFNENEGLDSSTSTGAAPTYGSVSGVCRSGFYLQNSTQTPITRDATLSSALTEGWVHCRIWAQFNFTCASTQDKDTFSILDTSGAEIVTVRRRCNSGGGGSQNQVFLDTPTTSVKIYESGALAIALSPAFNFDFHIKLDAVTGFIKVYDSGSLLHEETGDTTVTSGVTQFDTLRFKDANWLAGGSTNEDDTANFSQVVASNNITTGCKLYTLVPSAGSINDWDSGTFSDVDEQGINDTDKATTTTNGDEFTIDSSTTLSTPTFPNAFNAIVLSFRGSYDSGAAVTKLSALLNNTTATSTSYGTSQSLTTGFANYREIWNSDPSDSAPWTAARINDYEFGVRADT